MHLHHLIVDAAPCANGRFWRADACLQLARGRTDFEFAAVHFELLL